MNAEAKRLAFLTSYRDGCQVALNGLLTLKYCNIDTSRYEQELNRVLAVFTKDKPQKNELVEACTTFDNIAFEMAFEFSEWLSLVDRPCNPEIVIDLDKSSMLYAQQFSKALDAKQTHAAGFDEPRN